mmetsp:Transcript_3109/g.9498  ORF Transcript_3109/g.9498 Transcript_3109/m.9498 type:complete len:349 (+) Transcript_3109:145-1191(+)
MNWEKRSAGLLLYTVLAGGVVLAGCPLGCKWFHDGCNVCICKGAETELCTSFQCESPGKAACLKWQSGGNLIGSTETTARTSAAEPVPVRCTKGCKTFFDGCNTCSCGEDGKFLHCTLKLCTPGSRQKPKCLRRREGPKLRPEPTLNPKLCPPGCKTFFDGCNTCGCAQNGDRLACTEIACDTIDEPKCSEFFKLSTPRMPTSCPKKCRSYYDGCNTCKCARDGSPQVCTRRACRKLEEPKCRSFFPKRPRRFRRCPTGCKNFFDGCNTCRCSRYGHIKACTKIACRKKEEPKCLKSYPRRCSKDCLVYSVGINKACRCNHDRTIRYCFVLKGHKKGCLKKMPLPSHF